MPYLVVENLAGGVDRSRPRYVFQPGSLWSGINGHLSRGGDFEKRKAFVEKYALPAGTVGLAKTVSGLYVFGAAAAPAGLSSDLTYMRLQHPTTASLAITKIADWDLYNGKLYVIAQFENGDYRHYYDGSLVSDWGAGGTKPTGYGTLVRTHQRKLYSPVTSILYFPVIDTATNWDTGSGAGFQNMNTAQGGSEAVTALAKYQNYLAIFSRTVVQIWNMQDNAANNVPVQVIGETGTRAPKSARSFGDLDAFYLSDAGIRSLRARNYTNTAGVNDVGTPIDPVVLEWIDTLDDTTVAAACSVVDPRDGRFWLAIGGRVFVFSYFPSKKISAWSWYEPGFTFTDLLVFNGRVYGRSGNSIYLYGGDDNATYGEDYEVTCALPFMAAGKEATFKQWRGMDIGATGTWTCHLLTNPNDENEFVDIGTLSGVTFSEEGISGVGHCTHIAPVLTHQGAGFASVSKIALEYDGAESK